jgi:hypothetical protein
MNFFPFLLLVGFFYLPFSIFGMLTGNPSEPSLCQNGVIISPAADCSLRIGYLDDYVYRQRSKELRITDEEVSSQTFIKLNTHAAMAVFNFRNRIDLYALLGSSQLISDKEIFTRSQFAWGVGGKIIIFQRGDFTIGTDIKYFRVDFNSINYLVSDGVPYNTLGQFILKYDEIQVALGASYKASIIAPYINATYLKADLSPSPDIILIRYSPTDLIDIPIATITTQRRWGLAVGATIIASSKATLSVESRMFNQNAIDVNLEIRF